MSNQLIIFVFAVITLFSAVLCELVSFENCSDSTAKCTINSISVDPCKEASERKPCKLKRGKTATISVDFTPNFASSTLYSRAYWKNGIIDLPLLDMETDGCKSTTCPLISGHTQIYTYYLKLSRTFPVGRYPVKWKMTGDNDDNECCFLFKIELK